MAVIGNIGDAEVRLENAAEEATMQKILEALGGIQDAAGNGNTGIGSLIKKTTPLGIAMSAVTGGFSLLGKAISLTAKGLGGIIKLGNAAIGLSAGLIQSQTEITGFTQKLADGSANILGFGTAIHAVTKLLYANYTTFQQLTTSGIAFGGRLEEMQGFSASVGISLDQLSGNLASNSEALARLGTGTRGATMAIAAAEIAFEQNKRTLQTFGLSFVEQNENFLRFFAQNSLSLQRGTMSQEQLIDMSDDYAKGLRRLAEITGMQADQLEQGYQKAAMNTAFDNFISQFDGATQQRLKSVINTMQAGFGDAGREAAMAMMMGVNPVTEGAQQLTTMMPGFGNMLTGLTSSARSFNGSLEDFNNSMYGQMNQFANANRSFADANSSYFGTLAMMGDPYGMAGGEIVRFVNIFGGSMEDLMSRLGEESPTQRAINSFNEAVQQVRTALADLATTIFRSDGFKAAMNYLAPKDRSTGFPYLADNLDRFIEMIGDPTKRKGFFGEFLNAIGSATTQITNFFTEFNPFTDDGRDRIVNAFTNLIDRMYAVFVDSFLVRKILGIDQTQYVQDILRANMDEDGNIDYSNFTNRQLKLIAEEAADPAGANYGTAARQALFRAGGTTSDPGVQYDDLGEFYRKMNEAIDNPNMLTQDDMELMGDFIAQRYGVTNQRSLGTLGAIGQVREPKDMVSKIHAGERVLSPTETAEYNAMASQPAIRSSGLSDNLVNRLLDETRENRVNLTKALNTLHGDMREMIRKQELTTAAVTDYS